MDTRRLVAVLVGVLLFTSGCGGSLPTGQQQGERTALTFTDDAGRSVALSGPPRRVVVLTPALLDLYYAVGGVAVGRATSKLPLPPAAVPVPEVGFVYNVNLEQLLALQPDLVIAEAGRHEKLLPVLEAARVPAALLRLRTLGDVQRHGRLFGSLTGAEEQAGAVQRRLEEQIAKVEGRLPESGPRIVILHASAKQVTVERESGVAGDIAKKLRLQNIAASSRPLEGDPDVTPYGMETLVAADPELILVVTMGSGPEVQQRLQREVESNPAWRSLGAVTAGRVTYLPSELFLAPPGMRYPEAMEYMARIAYPAIFDGER